MKFSTSAALRGSACISTLAIALTVFGTAPARAQDAPVEPADCVDADDDGACDITGADGSSSTGGTIVVTGSRIPRPNLESTVPITTVGGGEFFETGNIAIGDSLNELPQLRSTLGQQQSATTGLGNAGLNLLDLRGLGTQRTLVLVDGRRHIPGDIQLNAA